MLGKQIAGRAVKSFQDVETRRWCSHSMYIWLMQLKPYLELMEVEGTLKCNLNADQWKVVEDTCDVLEPFVCAERFMEGESCVTISPDILHKIEVGLNTILERSSNAQVYSLAIYCLKSLGVVANLALMHRNTTL